MKRAPSVYNSILLLWACCLAPLPALADAVPDGDINTDGAVDTVDVLWGIQTVLGSRTLNMEQMDHGDVAPLVSGVSVPDELFNTGDVLVILRVAMGLLDLSLPFNQFNIGDSIGEGEAANGTIGEPHHETVWSTGFNGSDSVNTVNERLEALASADYYENDANRDAVFNHALSGDVMADFASQAQAVITATAQTPSGAAGLVSVFLGNNDVCAPSLAEMTDPSQFEAQYRAGLDVLAASDATRNAHIHVSGIPAIYWLWEAKRSNFLCRVFIWPFVPCENLLDNPADDCINNASREDPNTVYEGDGTGCVRRKTLHVKIRDDYNSTLQTVVEEYRDSGLLPNARYADIFDVRFESSHVNSGDCFHPSTAGHTLLADKEWRRTQWCSGDQSCAN